MPTLSDLKARAGDLIHPKWRMLLEWADSLEVQFGPGVLVSQGPRQTVVRGRRPRSWSHPFTVSLSDGIVMVTNGFLNGERVRMADRYLDGFEEDGITPADRPRLELKDRPKEGNRSWIVLTEDGEIVHQVEHSTDVAHLAIIIWENERPVRKVQITRHNQASGKGSDRAYFWAV